MLSFKQGKDIPQIWRGAIALILLGAFAGCTSKSKMAIAPSATVI